MDELRIGTEHEVGDVQNLALLILDPDGKRSDSHWQKTAYSLLVGCILHLCYKGKVEGTPATFAALDQMLADSSRPIQDLWAEMLAYAHINGRNHPVVSASAHNMMDRPSQEAGSVLSTTKTFLDLYLDPTVAKNTSRSDFRIRDLMHYADPVSLYIIRQMRRPFERYGSTSGRYQNLVITLRYYGSRHLFVNHSQLVLQRRSLWYRRRSSARGSMGSINPFRIRVKLLKPDLAFALAWWSAFLPENDENVLGSTTMNLQRFDDSWKL